MFGGSLSGARVRPFGTSASEGQVWHVIISPWLVLCESLGVSLGVVLSRSTAWMMGL